MNDIPDSKLEELKEAFDKAAPEGDKRVEFVVRVNNKLDETVKMKLFGDDNDTEQMEEESQESLLALDYIQSARTILSYANEPTYLKTVYIMSYLELLAGISEHIQRHEPTEFVDKPTLDDSIHVPKGMLRITSNAFINNIGFNSVKDTDSPAETISKWFNNGYRDIETLTSFYDFNAVLHSVHQTYDRLEPLKQLASGNGDFSEIADQWFSIVDGELKGSVPEHLYNTVAENTRLVLEGLLGTEIRKGLRADSIPHISDFMAQHVHLTEKEPYRDDSQNIIRYHADVFANGEYLIVTDYRPKQTLTFTLDTRPQETYLGLNFDGGLHPINEKIKYVDIPALTDSSVEKINQFVERCDIALEGLKRQSESLYGAIVQISEIFNHLFANKELVGQLSIIEVRSIAVLASTMLEPYLAFARCLNRIEQIIATKRATAKYLLSLSELNK